MGANVAATYGLRRELSGVQYTNSAGATQSQLPNYQTTDQAGFDAPSPDTQWSFSDSQVLGTAKLTPTWDTAARLTSLTGTYTSTPANSTKPVTTPISETNTYDGSNRLTSENISNWSGSTLGPNFCYNGTASLQRTTAAQEQFKYVWGTSGHPIRQIHTINGVTTTENLHWDGNTLLFTDNGQSVDDIKVGAEADYELISRAPSKFIVYDRDWVGSLVSAHNIGGLQNWGPPSPFGQLCGASSASMAKYTGIALSQPVMMEADAGAYTDGYTVFRGSASYNPALSSYSSSGSGPVVQSILRNTKDDDGGDPSDTSGDYSTGQRYWRGIRHIFRPRLYRRRRR